MNLRQAPQKEGTRWRQFFIGFESPTSPLTVAYRNAFN
jgi:hypothetical protein